LIAIATTQYWRSRAPINAWKELIIGGDNYYCSLVDMRRYPEVDFDTLSLPEMIRACKGEKGIRL
jgi:hypothetical protein